jgi:hypothetical protein
MRHNCPGCFGFQSRASNWRALVKMSSPRLVGLMLGEVEGKTRPLMSLIAASRLVGFTIGVTEGVVAPSNAPTTTASQKTLSFNFLTSF